MTHTPGLLRVREQSELDKALKSVMLEDDAGEFVVAASEGYGDRIAALWNMAERLGLATEEIESGNVETKLKAAPDMLRTLESVLALINKSFGVVGYHLLCGSFLHNGEVAKWEELGIREEVEAAIKKARGEE